MIVLTIKLTEMESGILYECAPSPETTKDYTQAEITASKIIQLGIERAMVSAADELGCPITLLNIDGKQRKKP